MQYQEKELFRGYEIRNWNFSPRLYKIFAAAAVFNVLLLFTLAQANIFTTRGCDSPLVGRFCQALDTIYLSSTMLDTNTDFISKDYQKTELENADITFVDVTDAPEKFVYPSDYPFSNTTNPTDFAAMPTDMNGFPQTIVPPMSGFPPSSPPMSNGTDLLAKPQVTPTPNPNAVVGQMSDSPFSFGDTTPNKNPVPPPPPLYGSRIPKMRRPSFNKVPKTRVNTPKPPLPPTDPTRDALATGKTSDVNPIGEKQPDLTSEAFTDFQPNKKPLEDFAAEVLEQRADKSKPLDLSKNFKVQMTGELNKDGKLDPKKSRYVNFKPDEQGDQAMVNVAKSAIEAINDSGLFYYLKNLGVDKVEVILTQDDKQISAVISSSQKSEERAKTISSGLSGLFSLARLTVKEPELITLINSSNVAPQGKNFVLNFNLDKPVAQDLITKKLNEAEAKKKIEETKPSSTATVNTNQKTGK